MENGTPKAERDSVASILVACALAFTLIALQVRFNFPIFQDPHHHPPDPAAPIVCLNCDRAEGQIATTIVVREGTTSIWRICFFDEDGAAVTPSDAWKKIITLGGNVLLAKTAIASLSTCNNITVDPMEIPNDEIDPTASTPQKIPVFLTFEYEWAGGAMQSAAREVFSLERVEGYPL